MWRTFRIGTRTSPLALKQVEEIIEGLRREYPAVRTEVIEIETCGDKDKTTPISKVEGTDFFTKEIDKALLKHEIDIAVHSAKDMPDKPEKSLAVAAITRSIDPYDVLVSKSGLKLDELPLGAKVGTSSVRRKTQLKKYRNDLQIADIRGNIEERLEKLYNSDLDAILIAAAGLIRLGLAEEITETLPFEVMQPHPLQGALAVVVREEETELLELFNVLDKRKTE